MPEKTIIQFTTHHGVYAKGDVAGFAPEIANRHISAGRAVLHVTSKPSKPAKTKQAEKDKQPEHGANDDLTDSGGTVFDSEKHEWNDAQGRPKLTPQGRFVEKA